MNPKDYQFLGKKYKCLIVQERLSKVLPVADIFISTYSSTVIWAVLSKVKCIVVDFYKLDYHMYDYLTSITIIKDRNRFKQIVEKSLAESPEFSHDWEELSRNSIFDGKTIQRYSELISKVSSRNKYARA